MSLAQGATSNLYSMDLRSRTTTRLSIRARSTPRRVIRRTDPDRLRIGPRGSHRSTCMSASARSPHRFPSARDDIRPRSGRRRATSSLYQAEERQFRDWRDAPGWVGERILTKVIITKADLGAERAYLMFSRPRRTTRLRFSWSTLRPKASFPFRRRARLDPAWSPLLN